MGCSFLATVQMSFEQAALSLCSRGDSLLPPSRSLLPLITWDAGRHCFAAVCRASFARGHLDSAFSATTLPVFFRAGCDRSASIFHHFAVERDLWSEVMDGVAALLLPMRALHVLGIRVLLAPILQGDWVLPRDFFQHTV
jgi:hypothetical protein